METSSELNLDSLDESVLDLKQIGANTVAVNLNWSQSTLAANPNSDDLAERLAQAANVIDVIQNRGLDVFLRSNVSVDTGEFSGRIAPAVPTEWFSSYGQILGEVSKFAQDKDVAMLSIASNLNGLEDQRFSPNWQNLIQDVRATYTGALTYAADAADNLELGGGFRDLPWWSDLDVIGVNAFLPLTFDFNGIPEELQAGAEQWADEFELWHDGSGLEQNIVFTNTGYRSQDGGAVFPLERAGDRVDLEEQALAFDAVLDAFESRSWWDGAFWRGWQADAHAGGAGDPGFTPQGKPAEAILAEHFGGHPTFTIRPSLLESWEDGFNGWSLPNSPPTATGALRLESAVGNTNGDTSLALPSGSGANISAAKLWTLDGSEAYTLFQEATAKSDKYSIELDVTVDDEQLPAGTATTLLMSLQDDRDNPVQIRLPANNLVGGGETETLTVSLADFGDLNTDSLYYELHLGTDNSWTGSVLVDNLRLVSNVAGDVTNNTDVDCDDIDALSDAVRHGWTDRQFDVNDDGLVNDADRLAWVEIAGTLLGDFDLNGNVEFADFLLLSDNFSQPGNWCNGDATGDRHVDFADFLALSANFGQLANAVSTPEPSLSWWVVLLPLLNRQRRTQPRRTQPRRPRTRRTQPR